MADKIENALNEARILVLVAQVLIGFQYQAVFMSGFAHLSEFAKIGVLIGLAFLLASLALLLTPAAYHRIVARGEAGSELPEVVSRLIAPALFLFALSMGCEFAILAPKIVGQTLAWIIAVTTTMVALFFWFGLEMLVKAREGLRANKEPSKEDTMSRKETPLAEKIKTVMMELRVVLPGAQALLGFQFAVLLQSEFDRLPFAMKLLHLISLACIAVCAILLMAPAAYHRIVEEGENTERLHHFASRMLLSGMVFLALGITGNVYVVVQKVVQSHSVAAFSAALVLIVFLGFWFGYTYYRRNSGEAAISGTASIASR